jgi:hypothetical protein
LPPPNVPSPPAATTRAGRGALAVGIVLSSLLAVGSAFEWSRPNVRTPELVGSQRWVVQREDLTVS